MADKFIHGSHSIPIKIKEMEPGDEWWNNTALDTKGPGFIENDLIKIKYPRFSGDTVHAKEEPDVSGTYAKGGSVPKMQQGGRPNLGAPPSAITGDPQLPQLSSGYWDRVRQQEAMRRATQSAPSGPPPGAAPGGAYAKGGKVKAFGFAKGGSSKFGKDYSK
jgi:hypothetical protein